MMLADTTYSLFPGVLPLSRMINGTARHVVTVTAALLLPMASYASAAPLTPSARQTTHEQRFVPNALSRIDFVDGEQNVLGDEPLGYALEKIASFSQLKAGWAGDNSVATSDDAVQAASDLAEALFSLGGITPPHISLSANGEISFYWDHASGSLDLGISRNGVCSYYGELSDGSEFLADNATLDQVCQRPELVAYLQGI